jgi:hypothetical protein
LSGFPLAEQEGHLHALGHRAASDRGPGRRGLSAYHYLYGASVNPGPPPPSGRSGSPIPSPLPPLFDPDRDRYSVGTAGPTPNSQTGSPRDSARREQRGLCEPPGQPADVHIFQHGRATFRGVESGVGSRPEGFDVTSQKQLKARIRTRMAATGERYAAARARLVGTGGDHDDFRSVVESGWALRGGSDPDSAALANVLAQHTCDRSRGATVGGVDLPRRGRARRRLHPLGVPARRRPDRDPGIHPPRAVFRPPVVGGHQPARSPGGLVADIGRRGSGGGAAAGARGRTAGHCLARPLRDRLLAAARLRWPWRPPGDCLRRTGRSDPPG